MTGPVLKMSRFVLNMFRFVLYKTGFGLNMTCFFLNTTVFNLDMTECVLKTSLLRRLQAQALPDEAPPMG